MSFLKRLFSRRPNIEKLESSGKEMLALGEYEQAGSFFENAAKALLNQNNVERAIENFMAAGRVYRNVNKWKAARCFLRAGHMYAEYENYEEAFKCYETTYRAFEKTKREREAELVTGYMILTQLALTQIDNALSIARGKVLTNKSIPGIAKAALMVVRGQSSKIPDPKKFKENQKLITTAIQSARAFSALRARLDAEIDETVVVGENIDVFISFQSTRRVTVTSLDLHVTNHAKQISEISPSPPFTVEGNKQVKITLALTLAGELSIGPLSFNFESDDFQFSSKTTKPTRIRVQPAKAHVTLEFTQLRTYVEENHIFVEGTLVVANSSRGVVEKIDLELQSPPHIALVGTTPKKTINMLAPRRSVSIPVLLKSKLSTPQTITVVLQLDRAADKELVQFGVNFERPEPEEELEEDTEWVKDLQVE